ncbi:CDP-glycerol glycerophosphotransferase family protein [uncultured Photobacterium sp.]|uniref:bifunctional glycosyltransferase/CDP-glycerol:glycerophosphate glycerophosphotransferase n=1 Tax=uncultured Photobacterium sp. TaxID=173973 RepID=UPI0026148C87|nr:CDP-glycerol glycerophosphotransferase family protein [uncultured Photobacterium sp.]
MKISIIITLYNRAHIVKDAIESALEQNYINKEIIIINDGSTDNYQQVLNSYKDKVIIYSQDNKGAGAAKNKGVELATGEYIIFLDSDDTFYDNNILAECAAEIATGSKFIAFNKIEMIRNTGRVIEEANMSSNTNMNEYMLASPLNYAGLPPYCLNRDIYLLSGGMDEEYRWGDAICFWRTYFSHTEESSFINKPGYCYDLTGSDNVSKSSNTSVLQKYDLMTKVVESAYNKHKHKMKEQDKSTWLLIMLFQSLKSKNIKNQKYFGNLLLKQSILVNLQALYYISTSKIFPKVKNKFNITHKKLIKKNIFNGCLASLFTKTSKLNKKTIIINSTVNNNFNFNSKYFFEYLESVEHDFNVYFIVNDDKKRDSLNKIYPGKFITNYLSQDIKTIASAKIWLCSTIDLPIYFCFKHTDRIVYHFGHGVPLKNIGLNEPKISIPRYINRYKNIRCFTHITCYSDEFKSKMEKMFGQLKAEYIPLGQPRNDSISQSIEQKNISSFFDDELNIKNHILYSPTWRYDSITKFFPFDDLDINQLHSHLENSDSVLILREHPFYPAVIPEGLCNHPRVKVLNSNIIPDFTPYILDMDIIITDYSSLYLDGLANSRTQFMFIPYDIEIYTKLTGFSMEYDELTPGPKTLTFEEFLSALKEQNNNYSTQKKHLSELFNVKYSGNCDEHFEYIKKLMK